MRDHISCIILNKYTLHLLAHLTYVATLQSRYYYSYFVDEEMEVSRENSK